MQIFKGSKMLLLLIKQAAPQNSAILAWEHVNSLFLRSSLQLVQDLLSFQNIQSPLGKRNGISGNDLSHQLEPYSNSHTNIPNLRYLNEKNNYYALWFLLQRQIHILVLFYTFLYFLHYLFLFFSIVFYIFMLYYADIMNLSKVVTVSRKQLAEYHAWLCKSLINFSQ